MKEVETSVCIPELSICPPIDPITAVIGILAIIAVSEAGYAITRGKSIGS